METKEYLIEVIKEMKKLLMELFTSGFLSIHDSTLKEMEKMSITCMQCGLSFGGEGLTELLEEVQGNRHRMQQDFDKMISIFCRLNQYIELCERKLELDVVEKYLHQNLQKDNCEM